MNRLFGKGKPKEPAPNLQDCINNVRNVKNKLLFLSFYDCNFVCYDCNYAFYDCNYAFYDCYHVIVLMISIQSGLSYVYSQLDNY